MIAAGEGFHDMPLGGWPGEFTPPRPPQPQIVTPSVVIPPPDWHGQPGIAMLPETPAAPLGASALAQLKIAAGEEFDPPGGAPIRDYVPLQRFVPPPLTPDEWRALEQEAIERNKHARLENARQLLDEHEPQGSLDSYPAKKTPAAEGEPAPLPRVVIPPPPWAKKTGGDAA